MAATMPEGGDSSKTETSPKVERSQAESAATGTGVPPILTVMLLRNPGSAGGCPCRTAS